MCHLPLSYPTTFIENCWWWLRQLLFWEWGGRTVSPCLHAHSTTVDFTMAKTTAITHADICSLHAYAEHSRTPYSRLSTVLFIDAQAGILVYPHAGIVGCCCSRTGAILVLPTSFFLYGFASGETVSFPHGLRGGFCVVTICIVDWELCSFIPVCSCILFSQTGMVV